MYFDIENSIMNIYTLFWLDGKKEIVQGRGIADAINQAGYGFGALPALDFHCEGKNTDYQWNSEQRSWDKPK